MDLRSSECGVVSLYVVCCSVNVSVCFVCCVFVNCLVKQFAMFLGVVAILLLNVMDVFSVLWWCSVWIDHDHRVCVSGFVQFWNWKKGVSPILELESQLSRILDTFRNNPKTTVILGGDFNAGGIDWKLD